MIDSMLLNLLLISIFRHRSISGLARQLCRHPKKASSRCQLWQYDQQMTLIYQQRIPAYHVSIFRCTLAKPSFVTSCWWQSKLKTLDSFKYYVNFCGWENFDWPIHRILNLISNIIISLLRDLNSWSFDGIYWITENQHLWDATTLFQ